MLKVFRARAAPSGFTVCLKKKLGQDVLPSQIARQCRGTDPPEASWAAGIVDDEAINLEIACLLLQDLGLVVDTAKDGLKLLRKQRPDLMTSF